MNWPVGIANLGQGNSFNSAKYYVTTKMRMADKLLMGNCFIGSSNTPTDSCKDQAAFDAGAVPFRFGSRTETSKCIWQLSFPQGHHQLASHYTFIFRTVVHLKARLHVRFKRRVRKACAFWESRRCG